MRKLIRATLVAGLAVAAFGVTTGTATASSVTDYPCGGTRDDDSAKFYWNNCDPDGRGQDVTIVWYGGDYQPFCAAPGVSEIPSAYYALNVTWNEGQYC